jgi:hypothetical protein
MAAAAHVSPASIFADVVRTYSSIRARIYYRHGIKHVLSRGSARGTSPPSHLVSVVEARSRFVSPRCASMAADLDRSHVPARRADPGGAQ